MFGDLKSTRLMYVKAVLFVALGVISLGLIAWLARDWAVTTLAVIAIWAMARAYYFAFYVIEKYIDPSYRFDGLVSVARYLLSKRRGRR